MHVNTNDEPPSFGAMPTDQGGLRRILSGARAILSGIRELRGVAGVRRAYLWIVLSLMLISLLLNALGFWAIQKYIPIAEDSSIWSTLLFWTLRILSAAAVILLSPLVAIISCNILFPIFSELPFLAGVNALRPSLATELKQAPGLSTPVAIGINLRRLFSLLAFSFCFFLMGLIPVVGPLLASPLQFIIAARIVGWELLDPYFDKKGVSFSEQKRMVSRYLPEILGLGAVCAPLLSIPLIGPLFFGLLQASTARFVIDLLETAPPPSHLSLESSS